MPSAWIVEFYEDGDGCPVREFLDGLDLRRRAKLLALIALLEEHGPTLPFPYSSQIRGKLRELRTRFADEHYRILYFGTQGRRFVLLHAFGKRTEKTPESEVALAEERMRRYTGKSQKTSRERKQ